MQIYTTSSSPYMYTIKQTYHDVKYIGCSDDGWLDDNFVI